MEQPKEVISDRILSLEEALLSQFSGHTGMVTLQFARTLKNYAAWSAAEIAVFIALNPYDEERSERLAGLRALEMVIEQLIRKHEE